MVNGHNLNIVFQQMKGNLCYKQNCNNLHVLKILFIILNICTGSFDQG